MIYGYITNISFIFDIIWLLIGLAIFFIPIIRWRCWANKERINDEKQGYTASDYHYSFEYWFEDRVFSAILIMALGFVIFLFGFIDICVNGSEIYKTRINENSHYEAMIMRKESLEDVLEVTDDIVNTDLYSQVVAYNAQLATIKSKYTDSRYSINFTGDCDWTAIDYIDLKKNN